jgi:hypothetical protein
MNLPRRGILIRLAIYVPVISFLAWSAFAKGKCNASEEPAPATSKPAVGKERTMTMPDGSEVQYLELTPDEARKIGFDPGKIDEASKPDPATKADAYAKAPAKAAD